MADITKTREEICDSQKFLPLEKYQLNFVLIQRHSLGYHGIRSISIDKTSLNLFITVSIGGIIHVCNNNGENLYHFGSKSQLTRFDNPWYSYIHDLLFYVTDYSTQRVSVCTLEGDIITSFNHFGKYNFERPNGLFFDEREDLYICDTKKRVVLGTNDCVCIKTIGKGHLSCPHNVKVYDNTLFILDTLKIAMFILNGEYQGCIDLDVSLSAFYFEIGEDREIFIYDNIQGHIHLLDSNGTFMWSTNSGKKDKKILPCIVKQSKTQIIVVRAYW